MQIYLVCFMHFSQLSIGFEFDAILIVELKSFLRRRRVGKLADLFVGRVGAFFRVSSAHA